MPEHKYLKKFIEASPSGDFANLRKAVEYGRDKCLNELEISGLVGRGGAGFSTAAKWKFAWNSPDVVLICNGDEGEPGSFKDRYILENGAFLLLEGLLISAFMLNSSEVYLYIRDEYKDALEAFHKCLDDNLDLIVWYCEQVNPGFELKVVCGGGAYVCGDETSLINSLEGKRPHSRIKPPYPAEKGLRGLPTIVNNVETLSNLPLIIRDGGEKFSSMGVEGSRGSKLICLSGNVEKPGLYEIEMGKITLEEIIYTLGGGCPNGKLKFVIPGGTSTAVLAPDGLKIAVDYGSLRKAGTSLGTGAVIVADESVDALDAACNAADFFMSETCGICFPCKEGNRQIDHLLNLIRQGKGQESYLKLIQDVALTASCAARCGLGQSCGNMVTSLIDKFRTDFVGAKL
ncbi:MAG: SLBB domain-containing protein [Victivallales bacterium]|nr:SLBB domain-containing protein [Victivallales bacterium]